MIFHSAIMPYLGAAERAAFFAAVRLLDAVWIANEARHCQPPTAASAAVDPSPSQFIIAKKGEPVATATPHGQWLRWL